MSSVGGNSNGDTKSFPAVRPRWLASRTIIAADWPGPAACRGPGLEGKASRPQADRYGGDGSADGDKGQLPEIIRLIVEGPVAWTRVPPWTEPLDDEWASMVETWERIDGTYYTLNQRGASYVGVYLVELTPRQAIVAREFGLPASKDEPTLMRWAWVGDDGPRPRAEPEWQDRRIQPKIVDMDCILPKCIKWEPDCLDRAVRDANGTGNDDGDGRPTKMEKLAGEIRKVNGVTGKA
jgi:hypothetical protein